MKISKGQRALLIDTMARRGQESQPFQMIGKDLGIVRQLAERGWFEEVRPGIWRQTRNGHLAALEAARMPEPGKWHGRIVRKAQVTK